MRVALFDYGVGNLHSLGKALEASDALVSVTSDWSEALSLDALVLPGGQINPDVLRADPKVVSFVREFFNSKKPLAAICHAPWLLIEADVVRGRDVTSYKSIKTDVVNAGGNWHDKEVVVHEGLITSRNPGDIPAFVAKIIEEVEEGRHEDRKVA